MSFPFIIQGNNVTVVIGNKPHTISKTHITYQKVVDAIKQGDWDTVKDIIEPKKVVLDFGQGRVSIKGETLYWDGEVFNGTIAVRMINMLQEGFTIDPLVKFMENLMDNPSKRSVDELYGFLEKNNLPITPDGHILAYKKVRSDYLDVYSGTMDNSPGQIVQMARNKVDDNKDQTCSTGLHFCSEGYLNHFGGERTVIVKINPKDVVSIPTDYDFSKGRIPARMSGDVVTQANQQPRDPASVKARAIGTREHAHEERRHRVGHRHMGAPLRLPGESRNLRQRRHAQLKTGSPAIFRGYANRRPHLPAASPRRLILP